MSGDHAARRFRHLYIRHSFVISRSDFGMYVDAALPT